MSLSLSPLSFSSSSLKSSLSRLSDTILAYNSCLAAFSFSPPVADWRRDHGMTIPQSRKGWLRIMSLTAADWGDVVSSEDEVSGWENVVSREDVVSSETSFMGVDKAPFNLQRIRRAAAARRAGSLFHRQGQWHACPRPCLCPCHCSCRMLFCLVFAKEMSTARLPLSLPFLPCCCVLPFISYVRVHFLLSSVYEWYVSTGGSCVEHDVRIGWENVSGEHCRWYIFLHRYEHARSLPSCSTMWMALFPSLCVCVCDCRTTFGSFLETHLHITFKNVNNAVMVCCYILGLPERRGYVPMWLVVFLQRNIWFNLRFSCRFKRPATTWLTW